jgi:predicted transcriptional regulator
MAKVNLKAKGRPPFYRKGYEKGVESAVQQQDSHIPLVNENAAKILDYLDGEFPQLRTITEAADATRLDRKTIRRYLRILREKGLVTADAKAKTMYALTPKGRDYVKEHLS